jgi:peroxiredoxin
MNRCLLLLPLLLAVPLVPAQEGPAPRKVANFTLPDAAGKPVTLADFRDRKAVAVVFLGVECPLVNLYAARLKELHREFAGQGVQFLAVNSNAQDTPAAVAAHAREHQLPFPVLKDADQKVADLFGAKRTPEAFLLDAGGTVRYQGRIDDQYGIGFQRIKPLRRDLAEAIAEVLAGKPVSKPVTEVAGCVIGRSARAAAPTATVTFTRDVAPVLQKHCLECHRPGQIGPMALLSYEKTKAWADTIREVVSERRMPPWHADPHFGKFANDRSLPDAARQTLLTWIDQGCPRGDDRDLPPPATFRGADGWAIGKPDVVLTMTEPYVVPAKAPIFGLRYQNFRVPTNFDRDVWVQAAECKPGNRAVVHHIIVYVVEAGKRLNLTDASQIGNALLAATAPGDMPTLNPPGTGKKIPKGATLLFQMHYTPNGVEATDRSSIGLIFCKEPPKHPVHTRAVLNERFGIPPGAPAHEVKSSTVFQREAILVGVMPHMHLRGKDFKYELVYPDGRQETILFVPRFDFAWQSSYVFAAPIKVPAGTRMNCTAHFDNSADNPNNPNPQRTVYWGEMTWEEMMIGWVNFYNVDEPAQ